MFPRASLRGCASGSAARGPLAHVGVRSWRSYAATSGEWCIANGAAPGCGPLSARSARSESRFRRACRPSERGRGRPSHPPSCTVSRSLPGRRPRRRAGRRSEAAWGGRAARSKLMAGSSSRAESASRLNEPPRANPVSRTALSPTCEWKCRFTLCGPDQNDAVLDGQF